jgi:hypothetical protein
MLQGIATDRKSLSQPWTVVDGERVNRREILSVLDRAAADYAFIAELTRIGSAALRDYALSAKEQAALISGDIRWIEEHVGKLEARLRTWPDCRLQQENW